jgi:hypothetical protein
MSTTDVTAGSEVAKPSRRKLWIGRVVSALPVLMLMFSASFKLTRNPEALQMFTGKFGYPGSSMFPIGIVEVACAVLYAIPQTAVLGAVLTTAYLGGAVATHVRASDPFLPPIVLGILVWVGLYLRDERLRPLLPLRRLESRG